MYTLKPAQLFRIAVVRGDCLSFFLAAGIALPIYLETMPPHLTLEFAGLFSTAALYGGVPHPPGFPLWTLYGWGFINLFPFSNVAWRLGVASAVAAACACGVVAATVSRMGRLLLSNAQTSDHDFAKGVIRLFTGTMVGTLVAFESGVWQRALIADPWPLTLLLFATVIFFLQNWFISPERKRW